MIKLVVIDLDGTTYNDQHIIHEDNIKAIKKLKKHGYFVAIATGRPFLGALEAAKKLELFGDNNYIITSNGAKVTHPKSNTIISSTTMNIDDINDIYSECTKRDIRLHVYFEDETFITPDHNIYSAIYVHSNKSPVNIVDFTKLDKDSRFLSAMYSVDVVPKMDEYIGELKDIFAKKYNVVRTSGFTLEFSQNNTSKGLAVEQLAKHLNLTMDNVMTIGDAENDITMIKMAKIGVAMGNAFDSVKKVSDFVSLTNNEAGVAYAINKLIFNE